MYFNFCLTSEIPILYIVIFSKKKAIKKVPFSCGFSPYGLPVNGVIPPTAPWYMHNDQF